MKIASQPALAWLAGCTAALVLAALPASAQTSFSLGVVSLYKDRGVDQNARDRAADPALQGSVDHVSDSGLYAGLWASNGVFDSARWEFDGSVGYQGTIGGTVTYDVGYIHYQYPGASALNSGETYVGMGYEGLSVRVYRGMRRDVNRGNLYYRVSYDLPLSPRWTATLGLGRTAPRDHDEPGVTDYLAGVEYAVADGLALSLMVAGASRRDDAEADARAPRAILGMTKTW